MSSQRGNVHRTRKQKHANETVFKNNKHGDTAQTKILNNLQISNVCSRCKDILQWKIKFNKYKMLTAPSKCTECQQKCVKHAYNILCHPCAEKYEKCAKCGQKKEIVAKAPPTDVEKAQMNAKFEQELKSLPERKRRTFLRYLEKLEKSKKDEESNSINDKVVHKTFLEEAEQQLHALKLKNLRAHCDDEDDWDDSDLDESAGDSDSEPDGDLSD